MALEAGAWEVKLIRTSPLPAWGMRWPQIGDSNENLPLTCLCYLTSGSGHRFTPAGRHEARARSDNATYDARDIYHGNAALIQRDTGHVSRLTERPSPV